MSLNFLKLRRKLFCLLNAYFKIPFENIGVIVLSKRKDLPANLTGQSFDIAFLSEYRQWLFVLDLIKNSDFQLLTISCEMEYSLSFRGNGAILPLEVLDRLLCFLFSRYKAFNGAADKGMLIFLENGLSGYASQLETVLLELSHIKRIEPEFLDWIENANFFCDGEEYSHSN